MHYAAMLINLNISPGPIHRIARYSETILEISDRGLDILARQESSDTRKSVHDHRDQQLCFTGGEHCKST